MKRKLTLEQWEKVFCKAIESNEEFLHGIPYPNLRKKLNSPKKRK